jgi:benzoate membrane transport protein
MSQAPCSPRMAAIPSSRPQLEKPILPLPSPARVIADFGSLYATNALVAFLYAATGPVAIILAVASRGGLSEAEIASWIFGTFFLNGLLSLGFSLLYRQPLVFLWSIPGVVLVGPALSHMTFAEVVAAFHATGLVVLLLGLSGWVRRTMGLVPIPIVMAMVSGVFMRFGLDLVFAVRDDILVALPMVAAFLALSAAPRLSRLVPPLIGAVAAGVLSIWLLGTFEPPARGLVTMAAPTLHAPQFSWAAMVELVVPLAITVLVVHNGQGIAVLRAAGHAPPVNAITAACGLGSILTALVGSASTALAGPVNAILASGGDRQRQYTGALFVVVFMLVFGLLAPYFTQLLLAAPPAFIAGLAGLAMLRVLERAFAASFRDRFTLGALTCLLVTMADVPIFRIGAPFWGLIFGMAVAWLLERKDFDRPCSASDHRSS